MSRNEGRPTKPTPALTYLPSIRPEQVIEQTPQILIIRLLRESQLPRVIQVCLERLGGSFTELGGGNCDLGLGDLVVLFLLVLKQS